jgi:hypothetical protein
LAEIFHPTRAFFPFRMDGQIGKPWKWVAIGVAVSAATVGLGYCLFAEKKGRKPKKQSGRTSPDERFGGNTFPFFLFE